MQALQFYHHVITIIITLHVYMTVMMQTFLYISWLNVQCACYSLLISCYRYNIIIIHYIASYVIIPYHFVTSTVLVNTDSLSPQWGQCPFSLETQEHFTPTCCVNGKETRAPSWKILLLSLHASNGLWLETNTISQRHWMFEIFLP